MSEPTSQENSLDILQLQAYLTGHQIIVASLVLYSYDWLVTFDLEVNHMWLQKWARPTWIFVITRYATFVCMILQLTPTPNHISCVWQDRLIEVCILLQILSSASFTGLRTYALCNRRVWVLIVVSGLAGVPAVINTAGYITETLQFVVASPDNICQSSLTFSPSQMLRLTIISRGALIAADFIALVVAWRKAVFVVQEASYTHARVSLSGVLIRDGSALFLCQLLLNLYQLLTNAINIPALVVLGTGDPFLLPLSTILICRFMLNLKQAGDHNFSSNGTDAIAGSNSSIRFTRSQTKQPASTILGTQEEFSSDFGDSEVAMVEIGRHDIENRGSSSQN